MEKNEFDDWVDYHKHHFPGIITWLGKWSDIDSRGVLKVWADTLSEIGFDDAKKATERLFLEGAKGPIYERHPQAIVAIVSEIELQRTAAEMRSHYVDREPTYHCALCRDDGRVVVWHPKSMRAAAEGRLGQPFTVYTCAVACSCSAGERRKHYRRYDPKRWLLAPNDSTSSYQALEELRGFVSNLTLHRAPVDAQQDIPF